jgi:hypothetical protein
MTYSEEEYENAHDAGYFSGLEAARRKDQRTKYSARHLILAFIFGFTLGLLG